MDDDFGTLTKLLQTVGGDNHLFSGYKTLHKTLKIQQIFPKPSSCLLYVVVYNLGSQDAGNVDFNKSIANDCVIPRHCKHFHSPILSGRFIFFVSTLSRAAKPHGAWNKIYVLTRHFITLVSYYKLFR